MCLYSKLDDNSVPCLCNTIRTALDMLELFSINQCFELVRECCEEYFQLGQLDTLGDSCDSAPLFEILHTFEWEGISSRHRSGLQLFEFSPENTSLRTIFSLFLNISGPADRRTEMFKVIELNRLRKSSTALFPCYWNIVFIFIIFWGIQSHAPLFVKEEHLRTAI